MLFVEKRFRLPNTHGHNGGDTDVLDGSKVKRLGIEAHGGSFHGLEIPLRVLSGARAVRVVHPGGQHINAHVHNWPSLTLALLGGCTEVHDGGEAVIAGPAAVLHPAGAAHADRIGDGGMETISLQFDPEWIGMPDLNRRVGSTRCWTGGPVAAAARRLAMDWSDPQRGEDALKAATAAFVGRALHEAEPFRPAWMDRVMDAIDGDEPAGTGDIARTLDLHPAWLARAYRAATGEGVAETIRRKRVERAAALLRSTDLAPAEVATAAGFCDQSHMNRSVRALIGRTPLDVRAERGRLAALAGAA